MTRNQENLSAEESLSLIASMIGQAKGNVRRNAFHFLLWGWVVVLANLGMFVLLQLQYPRPYLIWAITVPAWIISIYRGYRERDRETSPVTLLDRINIWMWLSFGITIIVIVVFGFKLNWQINPLVLLVSGIPTLVSGVMLRFRPLVIGGVMFWAFGIAGFLVPIYYQNLIGAVAIICCFLIPGYTLKSQRANDVQRP